MTWWFALVVGLVAQTALLPLFLDDPWRPDVTRALVLWVALTGLPRGGAFLAFAAGMLLDLASGAPSGFNTLIRLGLYGLARPFRGVFFDDRPSLVPPFAALSALVDAAGAGLLSWVALRIPLPLGVLVSTAWRQALVEAVCVPLVFVGLEVLTGRRSAPEVPV